MRKNKNNALVSKQEAQKRMANLFNKGLTNSRFLDEIAKLLGQRERAVGEEKEKIGEKLDKSITQYFMVQGLNNSFPLTRITDEIFEPLAVSLNERLIQEYQCYDAGSKALSQSVANSFVRVLQYSNAMRCALKLEYLTKEKTEYYKMLSKELDRANRHFQNGLSLLKQFHAPSFGLNIKTKATFIAQNQQFNTNKNNPDEKINPK